MIELHSILFECSAMHVSHTSENLAAELRRIAQDWRIEKKILLAVSDNAYNIQNALSIQLNWRHFGCFAHSINLIVKEGLKSTDMQQLSNK
jgi:hypothetical protein